MAPGLSGRPADGIILLEGMFPQIAGFRAGFCFDKSGMTY